LEVHEWCLIKGIPVTLIDDAASEPCLKGNGYIADRNSGAEEEEEAYVLVMDWLEGNLTDAMSRERFAGVMVISVIITAKAVAEGLKVFHDAGLIHGGPDPNPNPNPNR